MLDAIGATYGTGYSASARPTATPTMLSHSDAATVWLLSWTGNSHHSIAALMGTNTMKVVDILAENTHKGARDTASKMITARQRAMGR